MVHGVVNGDLSSLPTTFAGFFIRFRESQLPFFSTGATSDNIRLSAQSARWTKLATSSTYYL